MPQSYVDKQHKAFLNLPPEINLSKVVYFEMWTENSLKELDDRTSVYGVVQTEEGEDSFPIYYINCKINVEDRD